MENAKKMILIEPEIIEKLKNDNTDRNVNNLSRLDKEMNQVLKKNIDDREKWPLYLQTLQRYLYFIGKDRKPLEIPIISFDETEIIKKESREDRSSEATQDSSKIVEPNAEDKEINYSKRLLINLLPKTYKTKGELLIDLILKNKQKIYWDDKGTVYIDNKEIYKSNIVDLLNDVIRPLKNSSPNGWPEFSKVLKELRVPLTYIGNPRRATYINGMSNTPNIDSRFESNVEKDHEYSTPSSSTITRKEKVKKKIEWEKWTPY